jgi:hypothetical protein
LGGDKKPCQFMKKPINEGGGIERALKKKHLQHCAKVITGLMKTLASLLS